MNVTIMSYFSEYFGTLFFILTILASGGNPLVIGAALALAIFLVGDISGAYFNPAVTVAMFMNGSITTLNMLLYVLIQLIGGASAYFIYRMIHH